MNNNSPSLNALTLFLIIIFFFGCSNNQASRKHFRKRQLNTTGLRTTSSQYPYSHFRDFRLLKSKVEDETSHFHYESLLALFLSDQQLTNYEVCMLLIGYMRTPNYDSNEGILETMKLTDLVKAGQIEEAISLGQQFVESQPLNPILNLELMYCYRKNNDSENARKYEERVVSVLEAILSSGNGTCADPYLTFWANDPIVLCHYIGYEIRHYKETSTCSNYQAFEYLVYNKIEEQKEELFFSWELHMMGLKMEQESEFMDSLINAAPTLN